MYPSAIVSPRFDHERAAGYAAYFGPTVGLRASLTSMPPATAAPIAANVASEDWPVQRCADGSIDLDAYREAARRERARAYSEFLWMPLRRLLAFVRRESSTFAFRETRW